MFLKFICKTYFVQLKVGNFQNAYLWDMVSEIKKSITDFMNLKKTVLVNILYSNGYTGRRQTQKDFAYKLCTVFKFIDNVFESSVSSTVDSNVKF